MKKIVLFTLPILVLAVFYFSTQKRSLHSKFNRVISKGHKIMAEDTLVLSNGSTVDGMYLDNDDLWLNERFFLMKMVNGKTELHTLGLKYNKDNPIVDFYVENDSIYFYQANTRTVKVVDTTNRLLHEYQFAFPISYFIKSRGNSFLFQENLLGNGTVQVHAKNYTTNKEIVDSSSFSREFGSGMKYSGKWLASQSMSNIFFISFYDNDICCFDYTGRRKYKLKTIDFQNQDLKIIKEGNRFYLSPEANVMRTGASTSGKNLFISSYVREEKQPEQDFNQNLTIDVYNIENGSYKYSFYLPNSFNKKASEFSVSNNSVLYAMYGDAIVSYNITNLLKNEN